MSKPSPMLKQSPKLTTAGRIILILTTSILIYLIFEAPVFFMIFYHDVIEQVVYIFSSHIPLSTNLIHSLLLALFYLIIFNLFNFFYFGRCQIAQRYKLLRDHLICSLGLSIGQYIIIVLLQDVPSNDPISYWSLNIGMILLSQIVFLFSTSLTTIYYQTCYDQSTEEFQMKRMLKRKQKKIYQMLVMVERKQQIYSAQVQRYELLFTNHLARSTELSARLHSDTEDQQKNQQELAQVNYELQVIGRRLDCYRKYYRAIDIGIGVYQRKYKSIGLKIVELKKFNKTSSKIEENRLEFY